MCAMVYSGRNVDMRDKMPQTVPSAGFSPPCDYSAFEADCFDLSLLPCSTDCEVPLSPISIQHFLAMYSDPTTPPPMFHSNQEKDFDNFDNFKTMDEDSSHTNRQFAFENMEDVKAGMTEKSHLPNASNPKDVFENFSTLKSNPASMTNVFENFGNLRSPLGQDVEVKIPTINVFQEFRSAKSPSHGDLVPEAKPSGSYQYHSSPVMLNIVKEEPSYLLSPCMGNYNSPYAPSVSPTPSPSSSYASNLSPYPLSPSSQTGIKQEQTLDLQEILEESHFLQESINTSKKASELTRSHDLSQKVFNFCNILMNSEKESLESSSLKSNVDKNDPPKREILLLGNTFSSGSASKDDDLMSKSMAIGNLLLGCGSTGAIPKQEMASTSKCSTTLGDHTLLREVLKDTSFQRKFNLRPFSFAGMGGFMSEKQGDIAIKMEVDDEDDGEIRVKEEMTSDGNKSDTLADLSREKIEPVLSLAIEQLRRDVDSTCTVLGIAPDPAQWTVDDVKAWLLWTLRQYSLPAIQIEYFNVDGVTLAQFTEEEFHQRAPQCGSTLHAQLEIWKAACQEIDMAGILQWSTTTNSTCSGSSGDISEDDEVESVPSPTVSKASTSGTVTTSRAGGSHIHLWQFLKELLSSPLVHGSCIRWLDRTKGVFKIEDSVRVARLWGKRKNRPAMNYDKLSRSIRQYYKKGIMKKTERSQRLVYQFCHPYCL